MPPPPPPHDPRRHPETNDRLELMSERTVRLVTDVDGDRVIWRYEGGAAKRTTSLAAWREEMATAQVREPRPPSPAAKKK